MKRVKGQLTIYFVYIILAVILVLISALIIPMGIRFDTQLYEIGDDLLQSANDTLAGIENETIRNAISDSITSAQASTQENISMMSDIYKYSWVIVLALIAVVLFLYSRRLIEIGQGGFT